MSTLINANSSNLTGAFGGALTTALDVMTITHELDLNASTQNKAKSANPQSQVRINLIVPSLITVFCFFFFFDLAK